MPALKSFSAAEKENDQLGQNSEADRFNPEAEEKAEDPDKMDEEDEANVKRDQVEAEDEEALEEEQDSKERSKSTSSGGEESDSEFMYIELDDIRKDVQCPICLGIIRKTRTVMECLHRFCRECIDKAMRLGNNECPACRKHCASRRSLRDDPNFDAFIATLFKNIDLNKFEAEELAFRGEDEARKKQIQASIAQVSQRQSEALVKKKSLGKEPAVVSRPRRTGSSSRRRRSCRNKEQNTSEAHDHDDDDDDDDNDDDTNNRGKDSSSDDPSAEIVLRKRKKRCTSQPSTSNANNNDNCTANGAEEVHHKDSRRISPGLVWNSEILAWGRGGTRSNTRHGNNNQAAISKTVRNARLNQLAEYLGTLETQSVEFNILLKLVSLDTTCLPNLLQPYLRCRPTLLVKQLRECVARQLQLKAEEVEFFMPKKDDKAIENKTSSLSTEEMQSLKDDETIAKFKADSISSHEYSIVVYRRRQIDRSGGSKQVIQTVYELD